MAEAEREFELQTSKQGILLRRKVILSVKIGRGRENHLESVVGVELFCPNIEKFKKFKYGFERNVNDILRRSRFFFFHQNVSECVSHSVVSDSL